MGMTPKKQKVIQLKILNEREDKSGKWKKAKQEEKNKEEIRHALGHD